ncbi:high mobility group nucleosome-binding domain-containing protein 5-like [Mercenaria mercenaria]|uniref:high mobility group nucleosome-binding domain-containing protein 5-like n=1 Tax=Mercenaria mercenaria TaxID=6596 RepID=UPI00234E4948|nr:high mobility group nucleosome-binding domain-containing protein 5-like [Mercenaria mercenaria]
MKQIVLILLAGLLVGGTGAWPSLWNTKIVKRDANVADDKEDDAKGANTIFDTGNDDSEQDKNNSIADVKVDSREDIGKPKAGKLKKIRITKARNMKERKNEPNDLADTKREMNCFKLKEKMENQRDGQGLNEEDQSRMEKCLNKEADKGTSRKSKKRQSNDKKGNKSEDSGQTEKKNKGNGKTGKEKEDSGKKGKKNEDNGKTEMKNQGRRKKEKENDYNGKKGKKNEGSGNTEENSAGRRKKEKNEDSGKTRKENKERFQRKKAGKD